MVKRSPWGPGLCAQCWSVRLAGQAGMGWMESGEEELGAGASSWNPHRWSGACINSHHLQPLQEELHALPQSCTLCSLGSGVRKAEGRFGVAGASTGLAASRCQGEEPADSDVCELHQYPCSCASLCPFPPPSKAHIQCLYGPPKQKHTGKRVQGNSCFNQVNKLPTTVITSQLLN